MFKKLTYFLAKYAIDFTKSSFQWSDSIVWPLAFALTAVQFICIP